MSTGGQPPGTAGKVPVFDTAVDSFRFVFSNLGRFLALGWLPLLITFAAYMASDFVADVGGGENASVADWVTYIALEAASWAMYAVFAVRWHRFFLLDERESVFSEIFAARDWRFLGYTLLLFYSPLVPMLVVLIVLINSGTFLSGGESETGGTIEFVLAKLAGLFGIAGFVLLFVMTRFSLVLPSTAVDRPLGLGEAWHKMLGHTWRFIRAFLLVLIPSVILAWIVPEIFDLYQSTGTTGGAPEPTIGVLVATNAVLAIVGFFATAAGITVLSKFYRHIVGGITVLSETYGRRAVPSAHAVGTEGRWGDPIRRFLPQGFILILAVVVIGWLLSGFYQVYANQQGVVLRFGEWVKTTPPGLNWHLPYPIETVLKLRVERINMTEIGFSHLGAKGYRGQRRDVPEESLMVTGDQKIIDIDFTVLWKIADAGKFLFNNRNPEGTVKIVAESAMREIIGRTNLLFVLTEARQDIELKTSTLLQKILDDYEVGIEITQVRLQDVKPPGPVIEAYNDCQRARFEAEKGRSPGTARPAVP